MGVLCAVTNLFLVVSTIYSMCKITPEHPYAFSACMFATMHGLLGLIECLRRKECDYNIPAEISRTMIQLLPLPLINIELYRNLGWNLAMCHGFVLVPMIFDIISKLADDAEDANTVLLKDLTILGNIASLTYLGVNQDKSGYIILSMLVTFARFGSLALEHFANMDPRNVELLFDSIFFAMAGLQFGERPQKERGRPTQRTRRPPPYRKSP